MSFAGITSSGQWEALSGLLPAGVDRYVGLFTTLPTTVDGYDGVEPDDANYARVATGSWINGFGTGVSRKNGSVLLFPEFAGNGIIYGWGIWDSLEGGNLLACGPILNDDGDETSLEVTPGDSVRFQSQTLSVEIT
jgi:hypothetical protein